MFKHRVRHRLATPSDADFACQVIDTTMRDHALATWGKWEPQRVRAAFLADAQAGRSQIVLVAADMAGLLTTDVRPTHIQIEQLYLLPDWQRQGIGSLLRAELCEQSVVLQLPLRLRVLRVNPASQWYLEHRFEVTDETPERLFMQWRP
jgi:GNAT superfamily N-acetyltransferase